MKPQLLLIASIALGVAACAKEEVPAPEQAPTPEPVAQPEQASPAKAPMVRADVSEALLKHMHAHADKIDEINYALADGDLDAAMTPAYWLSRHDSVEGVPAEWQPFLVGMREGARAVEASTDLESARAAARSITVQCQACHIAAGIVE